MMDSGTRHRAKKISQRPRRRRRSILAGIVLRGCLVLLGVGIGGSLALAADKSKKPASPSRKASSSPRNWHASTIVSTPVGVRIINYWSEGEKMRAETLISGHPIHTIVRGDRYLTLDPLRQVGVDIGRSAHARKEDAGRERPFGNDLDEVVLDGGEKIEDTKMSGLDAEVWRVTDTRGRRTVWVTRDMPRVPLRVQTFDRGSGQTIDLTYSNWAFDLDVAAGFFASPTGYQMESFSYEEYVEKGLEGPVGSVPVLYPDLLHGTKGR